jgi:hypothetical protein
MTSRAGEIHPTARMTLAVLQPLHTGTELSELHGHGAQRVRTGLQATFEGSPLCHRWTTMAMRRRRWARKTRVYRSNYIARSSN